MAASSAQVRGTLSFGRFELFPAERLLTADGAPVDMGARTLDTLIALASRPNTAMSKRELMAEVWPDVIVEEGSLRFHIAALRKALGDGKDGARYIATLAGRGYCFVAPVRRSGDPPPASAPPSAASPGATFLPVRPARMLGRSASVAALVTQLTGSRFVSIVGPGGVGKTTVAVAVARDLLDAFAGAVMFVDLGMLGEARMVAPSLASMLGLAVQSDDVLPNLATYLRDRRFLIVLDSCEHVIDGAARLAAGILQAAPQVHILATSREPLRVGDEWVHRLAPLAVPPDNPRLTAAEALSFPAVRLFVERAMAHGADPDLDDADAPVVAGICRKLDGVALAIELAAGRVAAYGLEQTAALLDQRLALRWPGTRTAPPRQRSLTATLDWSYSLLSDLERAVLRRLGVFVGHFTLDAALAVATSTTIDRTLVLGAIDGLVAKSMIAAHAAGARMRYRLLDTTRAYVLDINIGDEERADLAGRHAGWYRQWLEQTAGTWLTFADGAQRPAHLADLNNVRAALAWSFGDDGNAVIGVALAAAAAPVFFAMSLLTDCLRWSQRALAALDATTPDARTEMRLQAALGLSLMWIRSNTDATYAALTRSIAIAEEQNDVLNQIQLFAPLHVFHLLIGDFRTASRYAERTAALSRTTQDGAAIALAQILSGYSCHFAGDLTAARTALEAALRHDSGAAARRAERDLRSVAMQDDAMAAPILALASSAAPSALARTLWLQGHPAEALRYVRQTVSDAANAEHPVTLLVALIYAISVLLWNGDLDEAGEQIARFVVNAETYALSTHTVLGRCFQGQLAIGRGDVQQGLDSLRAAMEDLRGVRYGLLTTAFTISLAEACAATGDIGQGLDLLDAAIRSVETHGDFCYMAELLRVKAGLLAQDSEAGTCLAESLAWSRRQGARAWELRTSIDLGRRLAAQGRREDARTVLQPVFDQFADGSQTADLRTAEALLASWA